MKKPPRPTASTVRASAPRPKPRPLALYRELRRALLGPCGVREGSTLVVACSGGPDSLALLLGLSELAPRLRLDLVVAHLDHGLRPGSAADARAVARRAQALGLPCVAERVSARVEMRARGLSGEAGLRALRLAFLRRVARAHGARAVALGHTADDQAETVLLRAVRGTGITGLAAMRPRRGLWVRPLLGVTRAQVREFLRDRGARGRVDPSNRDLRWARNLVRHRVLPLLRRINPRAVEALAATAESAAGTTRVLETLGRRALSRALARPVPAKRPGAAPAGGIRLVRTSLLRYHPAIRDNVIRQAWQAAGVRSRGLTRQHLRAVEVLLARGIGGASVHLPLGWRARLERGLLCLLAPDSRPSGRRAASGRDDA